jgi:hypothetical protein
MVGGGLAMVTPVEEPAAREEEQVEGAAGFTCQTPEDLPSMGE